MKHYVCAGECGGVSENPKNCGDSACSMHNKPLVECSCTDDKHELIRKINKMSPVVHFEMPYKDRSRLSKFYTNAFGWEMQSTGPEMGNYVVAHTTETDDKQMVKKPGNINGGFFPYDDKIPGRHMPSFVIQVDDIKKAMEEVKKAGGKIEGEPTRIPGIGMWVVFIDSEDNRVSLLQP